MTYIRTANGFVKSNITEGEADLLKPIDYSDPQVIKNIMDQKERARRANEAFIAKHGTYAKPKHYDPTCELSYLDERMQPSFHSYLEEAWEEEYFIDKDGARKQRKRTMPEEPRHHHRDRPLRPYIGCPDCPRWDNQKGCIKQFEDTTLCREIEDRYKEKGE